MSLFRDLWSKKGTHAHLSQKRTVSELFCAIISGLIVKIRPLALVLKGEARKVHTNRGVQKWFARILVSTSHVSDWIVGRGADNSDFG